MIDLNKFDLNLLVIFQRVLLDKRVSIAAASLGISQPTVSNALRRLRDEMGDELFIRTNEGMIPTQLAEELAEPVSYALSTLHQALSHQSVFEPLKENRVFGIVMTDISEIVFLPRLIGILAEAAPGVSIQAIPHTRKGLSEALEQGEVDFAIGFIPQLNVNVYQRRLFQQSYVCVYRRGHPLAETEMTLERFSSAQHLAIDAVGTGHNLVDEYLKRANIQRNIKLRASHFISAGYILETTDLISILPVKLAEKITSPFNVVVVEPPIKFPKIQINLFWHAKFNNDPANKWLRALIHRSFAE